jgi:starvation-inducible DNA-binding protein
MAAKISQWSSMEAAVQGRRSRSPEPATDLAGRLNAVLSDASTLFLKTRNFHWHMNRGHFRDHHFLLEEQAYSLYAMTDSIAEYVRKTGGSPLRSVGHITWIQIEDNDAEHVDRSLIESWIAQTERRIWFLFESSRTVD